MKLEYEDEPEMEEKVELITGEDESKLATGVTFDELGQIPRGIPRGASFKEE